MSTRLERVRRSLAWFGRGLLEPKPREWTQKTEEEITAKIQYAIDHPIKPRGNR